MPGGHRRDRFPFLTHGMARLLRNDCGFLIIATRSWLPMLTAVNRFSASERGKEHDLASGAAALVDAPTRLPLQGRGRIGSKLTK